MTIYIQTDMHTMKMSNIKQTKILEFINSIKNIDSPKLELTSANCAIFAKLSKKMFDYAEFVAAVGSLEPEMVYHIMLKVSKD